MSSQWTCRYRLNVKACGCYSIRYTLFSSNFQFFYIFWSGDLYTIMIYGTKRSFVHLIFAVLSHKFNHTAYKISFKSNHPESAKRSRRLFSMSAMASPTCRNISVTIYVHSYCVCTIYLLIAADLIIILRDQSTDPKVETMQCW